MLAQNVLFEGIWLDFVKQQEVEKVEKEEKSVHLSISTSSDGEADVINDGTVQNDFSISEIQKASLPTPEELTQEILQLSISQDCKDCMAPGSGGDRTLAGTCLRDEKCSKEESFESVFS